MTSSETCSVSSKVCDDEMDVLIRVMAIAVAGSVIGLVIKKNSPEMSLLLTIGLAIFGLHLAFDVVTGVIGFIRTLAETAGIAPEVLGIVMKTVGIAIISKISADICRDAGQSSIASGVELAGTVTAIYISIPLIETVIRMLNSLI